jgi:hypothetical protein
MFDEIGNLLSKVRTLKIANPQDMTLLQTEANLLLVQEVINLRRTLERITEASDFIPGGFAIRTISVK